MNIILSILMIGSTVAFATIDTVHMKPRLRTFQVAQIEEGKIYFFTANTKPVYDQLK